MSTEPNKHQESVERIMVIAAELCSRRYPNASKEMQLVYQLGVVTGLLAKLATKDITVRRNLRGLEELLDIKKD